MKKALIPLIVSAALLAACTGGDVPASNGQLPKGTALPPPEMDVLPDEAALPTDEWAGKWVGVEGLFLDIAPTARQSYYDLTVGLLDGVEHYEGVAQGEAIRFTRNGVQETIRPASGDETGLKWLAGKTNCLVIKPGEGFCRD